jgi:hypothetical protein
MGSNVQQLIDYIKSVIQTCENADRKTIAEAKTDEKYVPCPMKGGFSSSFEFDYLDGAYGSHEIRGHFDYYDTGLGIFKNHKYKTKEFPFPSLVFLTKEVYENAVVPALTSWLEEKVQNDSFGGLYKDTLRLSLLISDKDREYVRADMTVTDPVRRNARREIIRTFVQDKKYETTDVRSREFSPVLKDLFYLIPTFFGELPTETLKDAIEILAQKRLEYSSWGMGIDVLIPLAGACFNKLKKEVEPSAETGYYSWVVTDAVISDDELDFMCGIALLILRYAADTHDREQGEEILTLVSQKGYARAKDYLKFGTGQIGKEYTHLKTKKFEAIANDIQRTIQFKVKEEDAESYGGMLDFIVALLKQGFPADYRIKINAKLKNFIPVDGIGNTKTNLFFGNAATFPELWGKMAEYVREIFREFTHYSDASDEEAVTVGGYAVYALGVADPKANREIVDWFLDRVDFEHDCTARSFVKECTDEATIGKYL